MTYAQASDLEALIRVVNKMSDTQKTLAEIAERHSRRIAELESLLAASGIKDNR